MKLYAYYSVSLLLSLSLMSACSLSPESSIVSKDPEILTIYPDGTMRLMGRPVAAEDIVIYPDGFGGERAAIKVRLDPLRPDFYRDTIIVQRINPECSDN
jgi:hypothetical protein